MERTMVAWLMIIGHLLSFSLNFSFAQQTTMCISQFALANQACAVLPSAQALRGGNRTKSQDDDSDGGSNDDDDDDYEDYNDNDDGGNDSYSDDNDDGDDNDEGDDEHESRHRREHKRKHGNKKHGRKRQKHGRKHGGHGRKHGGGHDDDPRANKDCCRWLEELDESCVCDALLRLPPFLVKPSHKYSIKVGKSCKFSYDCYGI